MFFRLKRHENKILFLTVSWNNHEKHFDMVFFLLSMRTKKHLIFVLKEKPWSWKFVLIPPYLAWEPIS